VSFQSYNQINFVQWVHDLTLGTDFPRPLVLDMSPVESQFCDSVRRFVYAKTGTDPLVGNGLYSVESDKPGSNGQLPTSTLLDANGSRAFDCAAGNVLYINKQGQFNLQKLNPDGSTAAAKISLGNSTDLQRSQAIASLSPDGKFAAMYVTDKAAFPNGLYVYREDGSAVGLSGSAAGLSPQHIEWLNEKTLAMVGSDSSNTTRLLVLDLSVGVPAIKSVDNTKNQLNIVTSLTDRR
jgi:hypothetical protein